MRPGVPRSMLGWLIALAGIAMASSIFLPEFSGRLWDLREGGVCPHDDLRTEVLLLYFPLGLLVAWAGMLVALL